MAAAAALWVLVGGYLKDYNNGFIDVLSLRNGQLSKAQSYNRDNLPGGQDLKLSVASYFSKTYYPVGDPHVYVADEAYGHGHTGNVVRLQVDRSDGKVNVAEFQRAQKPGTVHLQTSRSKRWLIAANYDPYKDDNGKEVGLVEVFKLEDSGAIGPAISSSVTGENPHGVFVAPIRTGRAVNAASGTSDTGDIILVPCRAANTVEQYRLDESTGALTKLDTITFDDGTGPRHLAFSGDGDKAYLLAENAYKIYTLSYDPNRGVYVYAKTDPPAISSVPAWVLPDIRPGKWRANAAEIFLHPDGSFLYESTRLYDISTVNNDNSPPVESYIGIFPVDSTTHQLDESKAKFVKVGLQPRGFAITNDGNFLVVAHQGTTHEHVWAYSIDRTTGDLTLTSKETVQGFPVMVTFLEPSGASNTGKGEVEITEGAGQADAHTHRRMAIHPPNKRGARNAPDVRV